MILQTIILIIGLALLWVGAELLIRNSSALAIALGISPVIIGLSVVSIGTSLPEFVVSLTAALKNTMGISIGNIIGSNIANIGLILGLASIITVLEVKKSWVYKEVPAMIFFTILFTIFAWTGHSLNSLEGFILVFLLLLFLTYLYRTSKTQMQDLAKSETTANQMSLKKTLIHIFLALLGIVILIGGSNGTVQAGIQIAQAMGVSETVIGLTLIALGTSLPELATTFVGVLRKETDIVVGNIVGSNIFNLLFIGGVIPLIKHIPVEANLFKIDFPFLLFLSILIWPHMRIRWNLQRIEGVLFLSIYIIFVYLTFTYS
jgi:cation:H+ antiporter